MPEPELTLAVNTEGGGSFGYTIGNDMSSSRHRRPRTPLSPSPGQGVRSGCAAIGPCLLVSDTPPGPETEISIEIRRDGRIAFAGATRVGQIKRSFPELVEFLFRDNAFPCGCLLMTGTGVVPPDDFTLRGGDALAITIAPIGTLENTVAAG